MYAAAARAAVAAAVIGSLFAAVDAHADQLEPADRDPARVRVSYVEHTPGQGYRLELNNGAVYQLRPCRFEDSPSCVWDAGRRGNGRGRSFAAIGEEVYRIPARMMARAY